jgi:hypothetical protein
MQGRGGQGPSVQEAQLLVKCFSPATDFYLRRRHTGRLPPLWRPPSSAVEVPTARGLNDLEPLCDVRCLLPVALLTSVLSI